VAADVWLDKARALATLDDARRLWSLQDLAAELCVHVGTLRDAPRCGRLEVVYENRVVFGNPVPRTTLGAGRAFMQRYYKRCYSRFAPKPKVPVRNRVPPEWHRGLQKVRGQLGLSQKQLAEQIGAASMAVVYQWENRRRKPSAVFWERIERLL